MGSEQINDNMDPPKVDVITHLNKTTLYIIIITVWYL